MDISAINPSPQSAPVTGDRGSPPPVRQAAAPVELQNAVEKTGSVPDIPQLAQAVKAINKSLQDQSRAVEFSLDSDSKRVLIKVVDQKTKEILRQIPSEEVLEIAKALDHVQQGLLISQKA